MRRRGCAGPGMRTAYRERGGRARNGTDKSLRFSVSDQRASARSAASLLFRRRGISGRDDAAVIGGAAEALEHFVGAEGEASDERVGAAFVAVVARHDAED